MWWFRGFHAGSVFIHIDEGPVNKRQRPFHQPDGTFPRVVHDGRIERACGLWR